MDSVQIKSFINTLCFYLSMQLIFFYLISENDVSNGYILTKCVSQVNVDIKDIGFHVTYKVLLKWEVGVIRQK